LVARLILALLGIALILAPEFLSTYHRSLALAVLADITLAVSWAFFSGPTRYLSLATGAFYGAGAYTTAVTHTALMWPLPVLAGALVAAAMAAVVGLLALRLRGPYFAVFTFGLAELAKHSLIWYETNVTGTVGRLFLSGPTTSTIYYTALAVAGLALGAAILLRRSHLGAALVAIGEDEERAVTLGIDTVRVKITVFALSAAFMGGIGATMAPRWTYLDPQVFNPLVSFQAVIMALLGGATTVIGPVLGAVFLSLASEILLFQFRYYYMLGLGVTLIVVVLLLPQGLAGLVTTHLGPGRGGRFLARAVRSRQVSSDAPASL
jgi:branched-chain amino acid transport system permease protein